MAYIRLLSPNKRRLPIYDTSDVKDQVTIKNLQHAGWKPYQGPAKIDANGWVIDGTDPEVVPMRKGYGS